MKFCGNCGFSFSAGKPGKRLSKHKETISPPFLAAKDEWIGKVVDHRYLVMESIGSGGMGQVFKVKHQRMGKIAAMKVLHPDLAKKNSVVARFKKEAEAVSKLTHPNIVQIFDFGEWQDNLYLVMEFAQGRDLSWIFAEETKLDFFRAAPLMAQVCAALEESHQVGIVHRDLKPENILVAKTRSGRDFVKVLDFGLAKLMENPGTIHDTEKGSIVGTPHYMSPEQIQGSSKLDARSDVYSFGVVLYRMLTGVPPFTASTPMGVLTKHLTEIPPLPSKINPELTSDMDEFILRCLAKDPRNRFQTIADTQHELETLFTKLHTAKKSGPHDLSLPWRMDDTVSNLSNPRMDFLLDNEEPLRKADIDGFEKQIRRRHTTLRLVSVLGLLGVMGALGWAMFLKKPKAKTFESEPNNDINQATLVKNNQDVTGFLGKRLSKTASDKDFFEVDGDFSSAKSLTVDLSSIANMDLEMIVYDAKGKILSHSDKTGLGGNEILRRLKVNTRPFILVQQPPQKDSPLPVENISDSYLLHVAVEDVSANKESEPNESPSDATPLPPGQPVTGWLDTEKDRDVFVYKGKSKSIKAHLKASSKSIEWSVGEGAFRPWSKQGQTLKSGDTLSLRLKPSPQSLSLIHI